MPLAPSPTLTQTDIFNEAIAVVPLVHVPVGENQHMLAVGNAAVSAAILALRYPSFSEVVLVGDNIPAGLRSDRRVRIFAKPSEIPAGWRADLVVVAAVTIDDALLVQLRAHAAPRAVVCFALSQPSTGRQVKELLRRYWPVIQPYREHLPEPAVFMLAGDGPFGRHRPVPGFTRRISDKYLPAMFTWAKDEYAALFGGAS